MHIATCKEVKLTKYVIMDLRNSNQQRKTGAIKDVPPNWSTSYMVKDDQLSPCDCWSKLLCEETHGCYHLEPRGHDSRLNCFLLTDPAIVCRIITDERSSEQEVREVLNNIKDMDTTLEQRKKVIVSFREERCEEIADESKYKHSIESYKDEGESEPVLERLSPTTYRLPNCITRLCQPLLSIFSKHRVAVTYDTIKRNCEGFTNEEIMQALEFLHRLSVVYYLKPCKGESSKTDESAIFLQPGFYDAFLDASITKEERYIGAHAFLKKKLCGSKIGARLFEELLIKLGLACNISENECIIPMILSEEAEECIDTVDPLYISDVVENGHVTRNRFWQFVNGLTQNLIQKENKTSVEIMKYKALFVKIRYLVGTFIYVYHLFEEGFIKIRVERRRVSSLKNLQESLCQDKEIKTISTRCNNIREAIVSLGFKFLKFKCVSSDHWCKFLKDGVNASLQCSCDDENHEPSLKQLCWFEVPSSTNLKNAKVRHFNSYILVL